MSNSINKQLAKVRADDSPSARDNLETMATEQFSQREIDLQQQLSQAKLLNYISTQIHQTLNLPLVLQATVEQVQAFLHADRLIIYQFEFADKNLPMFAQGRPNSRTNFNIARRQPYFFRTPARMHVGPCLPRLRHPVDRANRLAVHQYDALVPF